MMLSLKRLQFLYQFVDFQLNSMLFNHCKLNIQIDNPHNRDDGLLGDYCDGEEFQHIHYLVRIGMYGFIAFLTQQNIGLYTCLNSEKHHTFTATLQIFFSL